MGMDYGVIEVVVNRKRNPLMDVGKIALIAVTVVFALNGITMMVTSVVFGLISIAIAIGAGVGAYFVSLNCVVDYEYALIDRELRIAKIMNKEKRKSLGEYDLDKMEILAPMHSHQLDSLRARQGVNSLDYSTHDKAREQTTYYCYLEGSKCLVLDIDGDYGEKMLSAIRSFAPRKVFTD